MTQSTSILWRRLDQAGHEAARLVETASGYALDGSAVFAEAGAPCRLNYRIVCDANWRTGSANVHGWIGTRGVALDITADAQRRWFVNGIECADALGCEDLDLSFSPLTNLLPIRRLRLKVGARAAVRAAWLRFPECRIEPLDQLYERAGDLAYRYESGGGSFVTVLQVNPAGFITHYPDLWTCESSL